jgi:hypothetical protein
MKIAELTESVVSTIKETQALPGQESVENVTGAILASVGRLSHELARLSGSSEFRALLQRARVDGYLTDRSRAPCAAGFHPLHGGVAFTLFHAGTGGVFVFNDVTSLNQLATVNGPGRLEDGFAAALTSLRDALRGA